MRHALCIGVTKCLTKDEAEGEAKWKAKNRRWSETRGRNEVAKRVDETRGALKRVGIETDGATKNGRTGKV